MTRLPIRWKLTAWYALLLTAALVLFGAAIYFGLSRELDNDLEEQLKRQALLIERTVANTSGAPIIDLTGLADPDDEQFMRAWDLDGQLISQSGGTGRVGPADQDSVNAAREGRTVRSRLNDDDVSLQIRTAPLRRSGAIIAVLEIGTSREDINDTLSRLRWLLSIAAPVLLVIAIGGGYLLAGQVLAPVARITDVARSIRGPNLDARLNLDLPDDELGRLASTFDAMLGRIEDAFERQRRFTGDAAHELRTPLTLMRSRVDVALARPRSAGEYRAELARMETDLSRLAGIVSTLLALTRSDTGQLGLERSAFDLADVVALVAEQYRASAAEARVEVRTATAPAPLKADEDELVQVLVNLLDNALAYSPPGGVVTIGCRRDGETVRFWVSDTGAGIGPEHQERVFDRFYRVDAGRSRGTGGVGLGLSISRAILEAHGGSIRVAPAAMAGTRIEAELPAGIP